MLSYRVRTDNRLLPRNIRCPNCNARHYTVRTETKQYMEEGEISIECGCGCWYQVLNRGTSSVIRKKVKGDARLQNIV